MSSYTVHTVYAYAILINICRWMSSSVYAYPVYRKDVSKNLECFVTCNNLRQRRERADWQADG